ncbi:MAG: hypothetical protein KDA24_22865 [Deltaproteobacteria bacterium]|nr:hypothetical protein [Deltaproteobacteria bacterium]
MSALHDAWTDALPAVLRLITGRRRDMFRHELQSFLAFAGMDATKAEERLGPLRELLLEAARAARTPAAISRTRGWEPEVGSMAGLCTHLLANWRTAEEAAQKEKPSHDPSGMTGEVFFGPRLGGPGRDGAIAPKERSKADGSG